MPEATVLVEAERIRRCVFQPEQLAREHPTAEQPRRGCPPQRSDHHQQTEHLLDHLDVGPSTTPIHGTRPSADPWRYSATNENVE